MTPEDWRRLAAKKGNPLFNRAIQGTYPPGSTFKMVTALAALEAGVIKQRTVMTCSGTHTLGGHRFRCWNRGGHGAVRLHRAIRESCDVYFYKVAEATGIERIADMARRLGLGDVYDRAGIAHQNPGIVPDPPWKRRHLGQPWYGGETLHVGIGQGYVATNPLQLAVMTARIASGRAVSPTLIRSRGDARDQPFPSLGIEAENLRAIHQGMLAVVYDGAGTGKRADLGRAGVRVAGKTGTSQVTRLSSFRSQSSLRWRLRDHALFVGFVPADRPKYAVAVIVEHGESGGKTAAPLCRDVMEILLDFEDGEGPGIDVGERLPGGEDRG